MDISIYEGHIKHTLERSALARKCLKMSIVKLRVLRKHLSRLSDRTYSKRRTENKRLTMSIICNEISLYRIEEIAK